MLTLTESASAAISGSILANKATIACWSSLAALSAYPGAFALITATTPRSGRQNRLIRELTLQNQAPKLRLLLQSEAFTNLLAESVSQVEPASLDRVPREVSYAWPAVPNLSRHAWKRALVLGRVKQVTS
jgi:hypothetical protein